MRTLPLLFGLLIMIACSRSEKNIEVDLFDREGFGAFYQSQMILWPGRLEFGYTGVPDNIDEYVIRTISMQPEQDYWELYQKGFLDAGQFGNLMSRFAIDTTQLADFGYKHRVLILVGTNNQGKRVIIADKNNDQDFSNDPVFEYEYPLDIEKQLEIEKNLPVIHANVQLFVGNEVIDHIAKLVLSPYETYRRLTYNVENELEKNYHLFASIPFHKQGSVVLNNKSYNIFVANQFSSLLYTEQNTKIFIVPDSITPSQSSGDIPGSIGETINLDGFDYQIKSISPTGDQIKLSYIGENQNPTGIAEGYLIPRFNAITLEREEFKLDDHHGKYILLDFWGTWCNPCIRLIPELKKLNSEFMNTNFQLVGVAFDRDIELVGDFVRKNEMDWLHLFADQNLRNSGSVVDVFKVTSFPTKILIDPSGKILARGRDIDEIREILNERVSRL